MRDGRGEGVQNILAAALSSYAHVRCGVSTGEDLGQIIQKACLLAGFSFLQNAYTVADKIFAVIFGQISYFSIPVDPY